MLIEIIDKIAEDELRERGDLRYKPRPSNAGTEKCIRAQVYAGLDFDAKPLGGRFAQVLDDSSWHEELSLDWISKSVYKVHSRQLGINCIKFNSPLLKERFCEDIKKDGKIVFKGCGIYVPAGTVHGHIDALITCPDGSEILFEHKAVSHGVFERLGNGDLPTDYVTQCCLYYKGLTELLDKNLKFAMLFVKNKNNARKIEYHIYYNCDTDSATVELYKKSDEGKLIPGGTWDMKNIIQNALFRWGEIDKYVAAKTLPRRRFDVDDWQCSYCRYGNYCWTEYQKEIKGRKDLIELAPETVTEIIRLKNSVSKNRIELEKEEAKIQLLILDEMVEKGGTKAIAAGYEINLVQFESRHCDKKLIPAEILEKYNTASELATTKTIVEKVTFKKIKE